MEINGRICRFFWQFDTQIIFWEFALCCLCQVKITTVLGNIKCSVEERAQHYTYPVLCEGVLKQSIKNALHCKQDWIAYSMVISISAWLQTSRIHLKLNSVLFKSCTLCFMHSWICQFVDTWEAWGKSPSYGRLSWSSWVRHNLSWQIQASQAVHHTGIGFVHCSLWSTFPHPTSAQQHLKTNIIK